MTRKQLKILIIGAVILVIIFNVSFGLFLQNKQHLSQQNLKKTQLTVPKDSFSYKGEVGKDALTLLKEKALVFQDSSGLVIEINGRKTDTKKEFWAFYVNGKFAQVGPADYQTKNTDLIEWRVEKIK